MGCALSSVTPAEHHVHHVVEVAKEKVVEEEKALTVEQKPVKPVKPPQPLRGILTPDYRIIVNDKSPRIRLDLSDGLAEFDVVGDTCQYTLQYCYLSQRGYYPNAMGKANQDSYAICHNFLGDENTHLFGIFDGHGEYGDLCSHYVANVVPLKLAAELKDEGGTPALGGTELEAIHSRAMLKANEALRKSKVDDSLSGTTAITVLMHKETLWVANVGDSRAIIASDFGDKMRYSPLSHDQTPFRKDERERVKKQGARVMTLEQIDGNEPMHENWGAETGDNIDEMGDPPRVWNETLEQPGCAFTRSLGDAVAEEVGVFAEPEVLSWRLGPSDRYVIIASDGVFEFLTSQAVVDILSTYGSNVMDGAKSVIAEAYRLWLTYDVRTDDISIIVLVISDMKVRSPSHPSFHEHSSRRLTQIVESKPVRRAMTKAKRAMIADHWELDGNDETMKDSALLPMKTQEELDRISSSVSSNYIFQNLTKKQKDEIFQLMTLRHTVAGEVVINEGERGEDMYIIDRGDFAVFKMDEQGAQEEVFRYTTSGAAFGELSLLYGEKRAATVKALTDGALWMLGRRAFRTVLMRSKTGGLLNKLKLVPTLEDRSYTDLQRLSNQAVDVVFENRDTIALASEFHSGRCDWLFFIVRTGSIELSDKPESFHQQRGTKSTAQTRSPSFVVQPGETVTRGRPGGVPSAGDAHGLWNSSVQYRGKGSFFSTVEFMSKEEVDNYVPPPPISGAAAADLRAIALAAANGFAIPGNKSQPVLSPTESERRGDRMQSNVSSVAVGGMNNFFQTVVANGTTTISFISASAYRELVGASGVEQFTIAVRSKITAPAANRNFVSIFTSNERQHLAEYKAQRADFKLLKPVVAHGTFAYVGNFQRAGTTVSMKVVAKHKAAEARMDARLLDERNFLATLSGTCRCVPRVLSKWQDKRVAVLTFGDVFCCDLGTAIASSTINNSIKPFIGACVYLALTDLHDVGLIHRYVTPEAVYITDKGVPKLTDLRYCKVMDGSKHYTVCGDPHYVAPEMTSHSGYDYAVDLWAFGVLLFELYEGESPFGPEDTDETDVFAVVGAFEKGDPLPFTAKTPVIAQQLIADLLQPIPEERLGYTDTAQVMNAAFFTGIDWAAIDRQPAAKSPRDRGDLVESQSRANSRRMTELQAPPYIAPPEAVLVAEKTMPALVEIDTIIGPENALKPFTSLIFGQW